MKKLRFEAKVYDTKTGEYVQRWTELEISNEVAEGFQKAQRANGVCNVCAGGHGDDRSKNLPQSTPLRDQRRYFISPDVLLIDVNENGEETIIGGWQNM